MRPAFVEVEVGREKKVILEEIKMVEDTPDDLVHELFTQQFWEGHPLGRPILGSKETVEAFTGRSLRDYFRGAYVAPNMIVSAAGNLDHAHVRDIVGAAFGTLATDGEAVSQRPPTVKPSVLTADQGARAEPYLPRHEQLPAESRRPVRQLHPQLRPRRLDELAAVSEHPREARAGLFSVQRDERLPRRRQHDDLRRLRGRCGRGSD